MRNSNEDIEQVPDPRFEARIAIYNILDPKRVISKYSMNMSTGGVFIETVNILPVDSVLIVKFKLPGKDAIITCKARVAWINDPLNLRKSSLPPGMGLQFLDLSLHNMHLIRDYLDRGYLAPTW